MEIVEQFKESYHDETSEYDEGYENPRRGCDIFDPEANKQKYHPRGKKVYTIGHMHHILP